MADLKILSQIIASVNSFQAGVYSATFKWSREQGDGTCGLDYVRSTILPNKVTWVRAKGRLAT